MKLKFKQQQYQDDAVGAIVNCFKGQEKGSRKDLIARYTRTLDKGTLLEKTEEVEVISFGNHPITLTESERRENIRNVQRLNDINYTDGQNLNDFSIEMETGTGKTYTYIKTMYELNKEYGWSKFIVMVPSIAVREGVQKSFEITQDHFQEIYHKKIRFFVYNSANSSNIANINNLKTTVEGIQSSTALGSTLNTYKSTFGSIQSAIVDVGDPAIDFKVRDKAFDLFLLSFKILYGVFLALAACLITLISLYVWLRFTILKLPTHIVWNVAMLICFLTLLVGSILGIVSYIFAAISPVMTYLF